MKQAFLITILASYILAGCDIAGKPAENKSSATMDKKGSASICSDGCKAESQTGTLACKLTTPELQKRKATILESLRKQLVARKELKDGYAFKFLGTDKMVDELVAFIKTERECCDFFIFNLSINGDKSEAWLELTGVDGAKDFIKTELEL